MMQDLGRRYVRVINNVHARTGTLWEARFKSSLIDSESYLLVCQRYIELNPVRAGVMADLRAYPGRAIPTIRGRAQAPLSPSIRSRMQRNAGRRISSYSKPRWASASSRASAKRSIQTRVRLRSIPRRGRGDTSNVGANADARASG